MDNRDSLTPFFNPRGVAVIGVSRDPTKLGYSLARNLAVSGYSGAIHFVNPKGERLLGHTIYPALDPEGLPASVSRRIRAIAS